MRGAENLRLYVNGELVATSSSFTTSDFDISNDKPLKIGFGTHDYFNGTLKDVRIYRRALNAGDVANLMDSTK